jgi:2-desacetyl-2-hydroxyethyl bacteriochlorophyllide A dehydrogenase
MDSKDTPAADSRDKALLAQHCESAAGRWEAACDAHGDGVGHPWVSHSPLDISPAPRDTPRSMLALVLGDRPQLLCDYPEPQRAEGEALIAMRLAGICDTDLQLVRGYLGFRGVLGHEFVGQVIECDTPSWRGRRVVADINAGCQACADCTERDSHHCAGRTVLGIAGRDGALAERLVVPERCLVAVPDSMTDEQAVFAEPLAAAAHVLDELLEQREARVIVLGDGKLGLLTALTLVGSELEVTVVGHHRAKLEIAGRAGARTMLESELGAAGVSADLVVEATGAPSGLERALGLVRPGGTIVLKSTIADRVQVDLSPVVINELRLVGSRCGNLQRAIGLLQDGKVDPSGLVTARYPLTEAERALGHAAEPGALKVLVTAA